MDQMDLTEVLKRAADTIRSDDIWEEAHVKQALIIPILAALGWDQMNLTELRSEYLLPNKHKVDYALLSRKEPKVFIEAKRLGNLDKKAIDQIFNYATNKGIPLLVLTDGQHWDFYLSMADGEPSSRLFYQIEISTKSKGDSGSFLKEQKENFKNFLSKEKVISGEARRTAEAHYEERKSQERARQTIFEAWEKILIDSDTILIDALVEEVEKLCGKKPHKDDKWQKLVTC
ncbi:type I restriction endonuclease [Candidatus Poriferisocius sp.]|uniref:type I restriction endonuclease n=1 Tax=Candidatus Poriferisocius sp. TaxID=3101276 RepID=UPI003B02E5FF